MDPASTRVVCKVLAALSLLAGAGGMALSFLHLGSLNMADIYAGASGFVAGAILIGSGLVSLAILACHEPNRPAAAPPGAIRTP